MTERDTVAMFEEAAQTASPTSLSELVAMARKAIELEQTVADLEAALKAQKSALHELKSQRLPDMMAEVGMSEFTHDDGTKIKVEDFVSGSLPKEPTKRAAAIDELVEHGGEAIIKNQLRLEFDRQQHNRALALADELRKQGYEVFVESNVHPQTLMAYVRERIRNGEEVDYEKLGCFVGRVAKINLPK